MFQGRGFTTEAIRTYLVLRGFVSRLTCSFVTVFTTLVSLRTPKLTVIVKVLVLTTSTWHHLLFIGNYTYLAEKVKLKRINKHR